MERWRGKNALVTGASGGIGFSIAEALAKAGVNVVACARNIQPIEDLKERMKKENGAGTVHAIKCDLAQEDQISAMFKEIVSKYKVMHILINNAGMAKPDDLLTGSNQKWRDMIDLNVMALSICAREAIKLMDSNGVTDGHIINVNSMAGHYIPSIQQVHFYSATKHMVTALSKALIMELATKKSMIRVTNLSPGAVDTDFGSNMVGAEAMAALKEKYKSSGILFLQAEDVAAAAMYVLSTPAHVTIRELIISPTL